MARIIGDLWPRASGTSSMGVDQTNGPEGGFADDIRPFNHVHQNSGVFHDPIYGQSGVLRFEADIEPTFPGTRFSVSVDGGLTFFPLAHSGQIQEVIELITPPEAAITALQDDSGSATDQEIIQLQTSNGVLSTLLDGGTIIFDAEGFGVNGIDVSHPTEGTTLVDGAPLSGLIASVGSLQTAYDNGDEITLKSSFAWPDLGPSPEGYAIDGILLKEPNGAHLTVKDDLLTRRHNYAIAVSGFSLTPDNPDTYGLLRITQQAISIQASGAGGASSTNLFIGFEGYTGSGPTPDRAYVSTSGILRIEASGLFLTQSSTDPNQGSISLNSSTASISLGADTASSSSFDFAGIADVDCNNTWLQNVSHAFELDVFTNGTGTGSGQLKYRFGPYEAWHTTVGAGNTDLVPIPHSGHVARMIREDVSKVTAIFTPNDDDFNGDVHFEHFEGIDIDLIDGQTIGFTVDIDGVNGIETSNPTIGLTVVDGASLSGFVTLQNAYENNNLLATNSTAGDLGIAVGPDAGTKFKLHSVDDAVAHLSFSGVVTPPDTDIARGDLTFGVHGLMHTDPQGQTTEAGVAARSLGIGTFGLNTGSGVTTVMLSSGIQRFLGVVATTGITTFPTYTPVTIGSQVFENDRYITWDTGNTAMRIMVPGVYLIAVASVCSSTVTTSILGQVLVNATPVINSGGTIVAGLTSSTETVVIINVQAGDLITWQLARSASTGSTQAVGNGTTFSCVYLGPPRGAYD